MPARLLHSKPNTARAILLALVLACGSPTSTAQMPAACACLWQGPFSKASKQADLIVSGVVISSKGNSLDFTIQKTLADRVTPIEFRQMIRVWGDSGQYCRPDVNSFSIGTEWLLALKKISSLPENSFNPNTPNISFGRIDDYYISSCGVNWLSLQEGYVSGPLVKSQRWNWQDETMNPVLLPLVDAYINNIIPEQALIEAAKPQTEAKKLLEETKQYIFSQ